MVLGNGDVILFYKYVTEERKNILENREIRITQLDALNDPFEALILYNPELVEKFNEEFKKSRSSLTLIEQLVKYDKFRHILENGSTTPALLGKAFLERHKEMKYVRILSLSKTKESLLMWSHYTDNFKGFVIGFNPKHSFFSEQLFNGVDGPKEVKYKCDRSLTEREQDSDSLSRDSVIEFLCEKPRVWEYEEEVRIIKKFSDNDNIRTLSKKDKDDKEINVYKFPSDLVQEIIIGHNMKPESQKKVVEYCSKLNNEIKIYETTISTTKYKIEFNKYSNSNLLGITL